MRKKPPKPAKPPSRKTRVTVTKRAGRSAASQRWLTRQLNDPYVQAAHATGFRSRSAYKLMELNERFHFLRKGMRVVDLGAAPGGWMQAALAAGAGAVVGIDLLPIAPLAGAQTLLLDATAPDLASRLRALLGGPADLVLSDMAPATTGHAATDHARIMALAEEAFAIASGLLAPGGTFVVKLFQGGAEASLLIPLKQAFAAIRHAKPPASRAESRELYLVATGFRSTCTAA
ncbi:MAG TPA: RlmE family RNA methyltransferase [Acetobacteraceae bacterium]|nr:RlmE family RNA methyltransferase [Acetobacteraceae bacterium]